MSGGLAEKDRTRGERAERELQREAEALRARRLRLAGSAALGTVLAGATLAAVLLGGSDSKRQVPVTSASEPAFGQHYRGLDLRRRQAGVPTMMQTVGSRIHYHPLLRVYVNGRLIPVPANIGIDPARNPMQMAGLHTHDATGTIHVEGAPRATLGKFFSIWGVPLSASRLGPFRANGRKGVRIWVDNRPSRAFGRLKLADSQRIVVSYGRNSRNPAPSSHVRR